MAGIYFHIPYCKKRCFYCDFYSSVKVQNKDLFIQCLLKELEIRKNYSTTKSIKTIYFGGGTPSLLNIDDFRILLTAVHQIFEIHSEPEITVEVNPDDITLEYVKGLQSLGINRISIGIQSFFDDDLKLMNRRHNARQGIESVEITVNAGISNISIDLIYGLPKMNMEKWQANLEQAFNLPIKHLSAYHLTYEGGTVFNTWLKQNKISEIEEKESIRQFELLNKYSAEKGFEHYEISNLALKGYYSQHNSNYWKGEPYLGLGPSAHSFNGVSRQWNVSDINKYLSCISTGKPFYESEILTDTDKFNEYVMTGLRTMWGLNLQECENKFGLKKRQMFEQNLEPYVKQALVEIKNPVATLTLQGMFVSDSIILGLFQV